MPNNELQELLSARFEGYTHSTDESVWDAIEAQLDSNQSNRAGIWFWVFNGIAATVLFGLMLQSGDRLKVSKESTRNELSEIKKDEIHSEITEQRAGSADKSNLEINQLDKTGVTLKGSNSIQSELTNKYQSTRSSQVKLNMVSSEQSSSLLVVSTDFEKGMDVKSSQAQTLTESSVVKLQFKRLISTEPSTVQQEQPLISMPKTSGYFKRLPIYIGGEFSYLQKQRVEYDAIAGLDTSYAGTINGLAVNRHFEFRLFSQFDFSRRFSAGIGFGYSRSTFSQPTGMSATPSSNTEKKSEMELFTIPVQAQFKLIQKNRFGMSAGLKLQSEFGTIKFSEEDQLESSATSNMSTLSDPLIITEFKIRQYSFEPYVQFSVSISPRISGFANLGYRMYLNQADKTVAPIGRLNYYCSSIGLLFRIR